MDVRSTRYIYNEGKPTTVRIIFSFNACRNNDLVMQIQDQSRKIGSRVQQILGEDVCAEYVAAGVPLTIRFNDEDSTVRIPQIKLTDLNRRRIDITLDFDCQLSDLSEDPNLMARAIATAINNHARSQLAVLQEQVNRLGRAIAQCDDNLRAVQPVG